jgi:Domain of unknown function (DUF4868)
MTSLKTIKEDQHVALNDILQLDLTQCAVSVCLASLVNDGEEPKFEKLQLSDDLTEDFREVVRALLKRWSRDNGSGDLVLRSYDAGSKPESYEVEYMNLSEHESVKAQIASLSSLSNLGIFGGTDSFVSGLRFYAIVVQSTQGEPIYCFRSYSSKKELGRSSTFGALFTAGHYDRVREPMFLFDQHIDCFSRGDDMFIFKKDKFQKLFRFFEMVLKAAKATLRTIKAHVPIANFDEFEKACEGHLQMQAKLKNIAGKSDIKEITIAKIKKVLKELPQLGVQIKKTNGKEMLVFDASDKWALLRLLDDDYLKSMMTGKNYEVTGKREYQQ